MAGISSLGIGSGILTSSLAEQLVEAERAPAEYRLKSKTQTTEALISAYGKLRSAVSALNEPLKQLSSPDSMKAFSATSSNTNVAVTVDSAKANRGNYTVTVSKLAQAQSMASATYADKDSTTVGTGTFTIGVGDKSVDITLDSTNNTLQGLANAINEANVGATAGIIDTGSGYKLVLSSEETGKANEIQMSISGDAKLSEFKNGLVETVAAQDAVVDVNGITITRPTNTIENVIDGVTLDVKEEGATSIVKVTQDLDAVSDRVQAFVDKFNALQQTISSLTSFNSGTGKGSILTGDATVRSIQNQLRSVVTGMVPGLDNAAVRSLADVGVSTDPKTGQLNFDKTKFQEKLKEYPDDVTALFAEQGRSSDPQVEFMRSGLKTEAGDYAINVTQLATQGSVAAGNIGAGAVSIGSSSNSFTLMVDGATSAEISISGDFSGPDELVAAIQEQLNSNGALRAAGRSVTVALEGGQLVFTSGKYGSSSNVSITAVGSELADKIGLAAVEGATGQDVAGTIDGKTARGSGQVLYLDADNGPASGLQVRIAGGELGSRGSISFIEGIGERTSKLIDQMLDSEGALSNRTEGLQKDLRRIADDQDKLNMRMDAYYKRLAAQFAAADAMIAQFNNTQSYLVQQLSSLTASMNQNK